MIVAGKGAIMTSNLRKIVFFFLLAGIVVAGYRYMIKPANRHLKEAQKRLATKQAKLSEFERATAAVDDLTKKLEQLEEAVRFFESKLPPESEIDQVLRDVTVIAQKHGLRCKTIKALKRTDNSGYVEQPLQMQLAGDFNAFYCFLLELEQLPRIIKIRELDLQKQQGDDGQIQVDFVVRIFFENKTV